MRVSFILSLSVERVERPQVHVVTLQILIISTEGAKGEDGKQVPSVSRGKACGVCGQIPGETHHSCHSEVQH